MSTVSSQPIRLAPSLICTDLCNLERDVAQLETLGVDLLHVDLLDGYFSPSMPIGLDTVRQLRGRTSLPFDVHLMAVENDFFVDELLNIGIQRLAFHWESARHPDRLLQRIRSQGVQAGLALNPTTPLSVLDYALERCDFITLMLINPGYAGCPGEQRVPYAARKLRELRRQIGPELDITVDGRIGDADLPGLLDCGATTFVAGSSSLFRPGTNLTDQYQVLRQTVSRWKEMHP